MEFWDTLGSFGGWTEVLIKQTNGSTGTCGISQVDTDYMERNSSSSF
jgi:hypothetical protein